MTERVPREQEVKDAWLKFTDSGQIDSSVVRPEIAEAWTRGKALGLNPFSKRMNLATPLKSHEKGERFSRRHQLIQIAKPFIESLYHQVGSSEIAIYINDDLGLILGSIGSGRLWQESLKRGCQSGYQVDHQIDEVLCSGIAVRSGKASKVLNNEQYFQIMQGVLSYSAPVFDEYQRLQGILVVSEAGDMAGDKATRTFGMVVAAAKAIENQLHLSNESERLNLSNEYLKAVIDQTPKGLIILNKEGKVAHINPIARTMLDLTGAECVGYPFYELLPFSSLVEQLKSDRDVFLKEVTLKRQERQSRYLVTVNKITNNHGIIVGKFMVLEEMKDVKRLVQRFVGANARYRFSDIQGNSSAIKNVLNHGIVAARSTSTVLVVGESGTGKEMFVQAIHNESIRREGPFLAINCAAIPSDLIESELFGHEEGAFTGASKKGRPGKFELAEEGTLFLDEIDKMPIEMQAKLLRVLEDKRVIRLGGNQYITVDVRIIAAANTPLTDLIRKGLFREDLFYRLNVLQLNIPPLRERKEDIPLLVDFLIQSKSQRIGKDVGGIEADALAYLCSLDWPGNVRQLENAIERAIHVTRHDRLCLADFSNWGDDSPPIQTISGKISGKNQKAPEENPLSRAERDVILKAIQDAGGNLSQVGRNLGISRSTLYQKIKKYKIHYVVQK